MSFTTRRAACGAAALFATASLLAACGSDDDEESSATSAASAEAEGEEEEGEYDIVSDAAVATGYTDMLETMKTLAADPTTADEEALEEVHEMWESFEGTVKQNDPDA